VRFQKGLFVVGDQNPISFIHDAAPQGYWFAKVGKVFESKAVPLVGLRFFSLSENLA
jgi:hypothetical protein